jgi:hypothetical protein
MSADRTWNGCCVDPLIPPRLSVNGFWEPEEKFPLTGFLPVFRKPLHLASRKPLNLYGGKWEAQVFEKQMILEQFKTAFQEAEPLITTRTFSANSSRTTPWPRPRRSEFMRAVTSAEILSRMLAKST